MTDGQINRAVRAVHGWRFWYLVKVGGLWLLQSPISRPDSSVTTVWPQAYVVDDPSRHPWTDRTASMRREPGFHVADTFDLCGPYRVGSKSNLGLGLEDQAVYGLVRLYDAQRTMNGYGWVADSARILHLLVPPGLSEDVRRSLADTYEVPVTPLGPSAETLALLSADRAEPA